MIKKRCMICRTYAEVKEIEGVELVDGRRFVKGRQPQDAVIVQAVKIRRVFCDCGDARSGRHP